MEERKMNLETALAEYGTSIVKSYDLSFVNAKGEKVRKNLTKPENVKLMVALDESQRLGKRLDLARCLMFATIERTLNQDKALGISTRDLIMQKWHYSKATTNQYLAIGLKFFTNTGNEKVEGISQFTVGQIIPFLAFVNDFPTIGGLDTDYKFLEWLIRNDYIRADMTTTEIEGIAKLLKEGYLPKEWIDKSADSKYPYFIKALATSGDEDMQFTICPYLEKAETETETETETESEPKDEPKDEPVKMSTVVRSFLATLQDMPMSEELHDELSGISETVIKWALKVERAEAESKDEPKAESKDEPKDEPKDRKKSKK